MQWTGMFPGFSLSQQQALGNFQFRASHASSVALQTLDSAIRRSSVSARLGTHVGRLMSTAQGAMLRSWPLLGATVGDIALQARWQPGLLTPCRCSASDAAGSAQTVSLEGGRTLAMADGETDNIPSGPNPLPSKPGDPSTGDKPAGKNLRLLVAAFMIPHPDKVDRGGEDAYFIGEDSLSMGVADGVGGWAEMGIDPGEYARKLMSTAKESAAKTPPGRDAPLRILTDAYYATHIQGSATACIIVLDREDLQAANLGDSGFLVIRDSKVVFRSPPQQHDFNFPFQLGSPGSQSDGPQDAELFSVGVRPDDIIVVGSDGLFDNVFPEESAAIASLIHGRGDPPAVAAAGLAQFASIRANDPHHTSPFAFSAQSLGHRYNGGKLDDITVLVAYVTPASLM